MSPGNRQFALGILTAATLLLSGCTVGPNYHRPDAPTAPAFKQSDVTPPPTAPGVGWKQVGPNDAAIRANDIVMPLRFRHLTVQVEVGSPNQYV